MNTHDYYLFGWNENNTKVLASFFCLIGDKLPLLGMRTLNPENASIWLVDVDSSEGRTFWQAALYNRSAARRIHDAGYFLVALAPQAISDADYWIGHPLRIYGDTGVLTVLTQIHKALSSPPVATYMPLHERRSEDSLFMKLAHKENIELIFPEQIRLWVDAKNEQCWSNHHPRQWLEFFPQLIAIQPAYEEMFELLATTSSLDCQAYPIDSIKWCSALFLWKGEPSPQASQQHTYHLKNWPNFTNLPHHPKHLSLTTLLVRYPHTIEELMADTKLTREFIQNFINACAAIDLLHANPSRDPDKLRAKPLGRNPLRALLSRLGVSP